MKNNNGCYPVQQRHNKFESECKVIDGHFNNDWHWFLYFIKTLSH